MASPPLKSSSHLEKTLAKHAEISSPFVTRRVLDPLAAAKVTETTLPLGIQLTGGAKLRSEGLTGKGVRVAVIDSGIDETHPSFHDKVKQQVWFRWGTPLAVDDHGTHVAGTIHMMAPDAEIYDYRVFGEDAGLEIDDAISTSIFEACFDGCHVINMSLGGRWPSVGIRTAVQYAHSRGVVVVCAAGNEGDDNPLTNERSYPALWEEAISVAAVSKKDGLPTARFSNSNPQVDYAGVGVDVLSLKPGRGYQEMSGTSMACPHVCGLVAALLTGGQTPSSEIREKLTELSVDISIEGPDTSTGLGFPTYLDETEFKQLLPGFQEPSILPPVKVTLG